MLFIRAWDGALPVTIVRTPESRPSIMRSIVAYQECSLHALLMLWSLVGRKCLLVSASKQGRGPGFAVLNMRTCPAAIRCFPDAARCFC